MTAAGSQLPHSGTRQQQRRRWRGTLCLAPHGKLSATQASCPAQAATSLPLCTAWPTWCVCVIAPCSVRTQAGISHLLHELRQLACTPRSCSGTLAFGQTGQPLNKPAAGVSRLGGHAASLLQRLQTPRCQSSTRRRLRGPVAVPISRCAAVPLVSDRLPRAVSLNFS